MLRPAAAGALAVVLALTLAGCGASPAKTFPFTPQTPPPPPTIDPHADEAAAAMAAFGKLIGRRGLDFHLEQASTIDQAGSTNDVGYVLDVDGRNVRAAISAAGTTADFVIVNGATWARERGRKWQRGKRANDATIAELIDPWQYLGPLDQLEYAGRVNGTPTRYRYRSTAPIAYRTPALDRLGIPGTIDSLELVLDADGTPVEYTFHAAARPVSGGLAGQAFDMTSRVELSKVGGPITVKRPD